MKSATTATPNTRERIMRSALALFLEDGYVGTSVRDIADANGVTVPALYYHFTNKDDLLAAIVQPMADDGEALMVRLEAFRGPAGELAEVALGGYLDVLAAHLDVFRFVSTDLAVRSHPVAGHRLAEQSARFAKRLAGTRPSRARRLCTAAAIGAIRRPLRLRDVDPVRDRRQILAAALAAYGAADA
ncbi:MAG: TetR/AcrR family transcriptional regulator [Acidimicrobiia bacterium]